MTFVTVLIFFFPTYDSQDIPSAGTLYFLCDGVKLYSVVDIFDPPFWNNAFFEAPVSGQQPQGAEEGGGASCLLGELHFIKCQVCYCTRSPNDIDRSKP